MKTNDLPKFARLLKLLGDTYRYTITEEMGDAFWQILKKYDLVQIEQAIYQHMATPRGSQHDCQRMPQPGDIIAWIEGTPEARALAAWSQVEAAIRRIGRYDNVIFDDPMIHQVIYDMGGWIHLCDTRINDISYRAHEFQKRYQIYLQNPNAVHCSIAYLPGVFSDSVPVRISALHLLRLEEKIADQTVLNASQIINKLGVKKNETGD